VLQYIDLSKYQIDIAINFEDFENAGVGDEFRAYGCQIFIWPYFKICNYFQFVNFWKVFFSNHQYDIVHGHSTNSAAIYLKIAKEAGCVTIAHSHNEGYKGYWYQRIPKKLFAKGTGRVADYWFSCSEKAAFRLFGDKYKFYNNYFTIPNAIPVENFLYKEEIAQSLRSSLGIKKDELLCGHVGTFSIQKNHAYLLDTFREVLKIRPDSWLVCCGGGYHIDQIKEKAKRMGIYDRIIFAGVVSNVNEYLMAMDVFVFPSKFEGFGMAVLEAEAAGLPIVMSDSIPNDVDLIDGIRRLPLTATPSIWAMEINSIANLTREECNKIIADSEYNIHNAVVRLSNIYEDCIKTRRSCD